MSKQSEHTLESTFTHAKELYKARGYGEDSWQWKDEGMVYAIMDYLSSCEMTDEDWDFARSLGIDDLCEELMKEEC